MKKLLAILAFILPLCVAAQSTDKVAALKHATYLLTILDDRSGLDGPFHRFAGEVKNVQDGLEILAAKSITAPDGVSRQYLFREKGAWPAFAADLTPEGAQAMRAAITEVLPKEGACTYASRTQSGDASDTYFIMQGGKAVGSLSVKKSTGTGMLVMKPGY